MTPFPFLAAAGAPAEPAAGDSPAREIDRDGVERAARDLLRALGFVRDDPRTRQEFLALTSRSCHAG